MVEGPQQRLGLLMGGEGVTQMPPPWPTIASRWCPLGRSTTRAQQLPCSAVRRDPTLHANAFCKFNG